MNLAARLSIFNLSAIARQMDVSRQAIDQWLLKRVPEGRVKELSQITHIAPEHIRPDLYGAK